ncbi:MAG TPA: hypothetical protein VNM92_05560 [Thermoanaerobaculia bacterium]|nr:hypothetical protein [Thermoanaerobaculia bacterium]
MSAERYRRPDVDIDSREGKPDSRSRRDDPLITSESYATSGVAKVFDDRAPRYSPATQSIVDLLGPIDADAVAQMDAYAESMLPGVLRGSIRLNTAGEKRLAELRVHFSSELDELGKGVAAAASVTQHVLTSIVRRRERVDRLNGIATKEVLMVRALRYMNAFALRKLRKYANTAKVRLNAYQEAERNLHQLMAAEALRTHLETELAAYRVWSHGEDSTFET